jgi:two-component sensor histidine kinase
MKTQGKKRMAIIHKLVFITVVLMCIATVADAQKVDREQIKEMTAKLSTTKGDSARLELLTDIILKHLYYNPRLGFDYTREALQLAGTLQWKEGTARLKESIGRMHWGCGENDAAVKDHMEALELYRKAGNASGQIRNLRFIGQNYFDAGKNDEAETYFKQSLKMAESAGDKNGMSSAYNMMNALYKAQANTVEATNTGYAYLKIIEELKDSAHLVVALITVGENLAALGNNSEALLYFKKAIDLANLKGINAEMHSANMSLGEFYLEEGDLPAAMRHYTTAVKLAEQSGDQRNIGFTHSFVAAVYKRMGKYEDALRELLLAIYIYAPTGYSTRTYNMYSEAGVLYTILGKYDLARQYFNKVAGLTKNSFSASFRRDYYDGLQSLDSATGNWRNAYFHYRKVTGLKDSLFNREALKKMVSSQMQYETDKKEAIAKAAQEKKDLMVSEESKRQRNIRNAAFIGLGVVLLFSALVYNQRNRIAREKLRSDALVQDKELLLREIHHRVKNNLEIVSSLLALQSAQIDDAGTKAAMQEGQNRVQSIGIVHQKLYQGENLGSIDMKDYFINLSESILDSFGAEGRVQVACAMDALDIDIDTAVPLGLIVNELLTNTLKYAFPDGRDGKVEIKLEKRNDGILQLRVSDNGVGKSGLTKGTGFGGQLISLLTRQLNGSMKEENNNGTNILFEFNTGKAAR